MRICTCNAACRLWLSLRGDDPAGGGRICFPGPQNRYISLAPNPVHSPGPKPGTFPWFQTRYIPLAPKPGTFPLPNTRYVVTLTNARMREEALPEKLYWKLRPGDRSGGPLHRWQQCWQAWPSQRSAWVALTFRWLHFVTPFWLASSVSGPASVPLAFLTFCTCMRRVPTYHTHTACT